jgi:hypothetical protein
VLKNLPYGSTQEKPAAKNGTEPTKKCLEGTWGLYQFLANIASQKIYPDSKAANNKRIFPWLFRLNRKLLASNTSTHKNTRFFNTPTGT